MVITFINADQKISLEYRDIKNIIGINDFLIPINLLQSFHVSFYKLASIDDFSESVIEAEKDNELNKIIWQFNQTNQKKPMINDFILKIINLLKGL